MSNGTAHFLDYIIELAYRFAIFLRVCGFIDTDVVVLVAVIILVGLFSMQHYGTDKVGWLFAPVVLLWFILIGAIGIVNIFKYDSSVLRAFSPVHIYRYFKRGGRDSWTSLGGIMLCITGKLIHYSLAT